MTKSAPEFLRSPSLTPAGLASALVIILLGTTAPRLVAQSDNFNSAPPLGAAWVKYELPYYGTPTFSFPADDSDGKAFEVYAPPTGDDPGGMGNSRAGAFRVDALYSGRFSVGTDLLAWNALWRQEAGVLFYVQTPGLATTAGYTATYSSGYRQLYISSVTGEYPTTVAELGVGAITLDQTHRYRLVVSCNDPVSSIFLFQLFDKSEPDSPWVSAIGQDTTYQNSPGPCGLFTFEQTYPSTTQGADATFDNYVAAVPAAGAMPATVTDLSPPPAWKTAALNPTVQVGILDRDTAVDTNSIVLCLDGVWIPHDSLTIDPQVHKPNPAAFTKDFAGATVTYAIPTQLPWGSRHTNKVAFMHGASTWQTNTWTWSVGPYLYASNSLPVGSLSVRGWNYRMAQAATISGDAGNSLLTAEQQLASPPVIPYDVTYSTNDLQLLQWDDDTGVPNGVPGLDGIGYDNIACEMLGYIHLTAGVHRFYAHSDDGFQLRSGNSPSDVGATIVGFKDGGSFDGTFDFAVEADGLYPVRCLWYEHGGQALFELASVNLGDNSHVLINDPTNPSGVVPVYISTGPKVLPLSSATVNGTFTVEHTAVVDQNAKTVTIPLSGVAKFFRLSSPSAATLSAHVVGSNIVLTYQ